MPALFSADSVLAEVRLRGKLPAADPAWSDDNLLILLNSELIGWGVPFLNQERAEYLVTSQDVDLVQGQAEYHIPSEAAAGVLRALLAIDPGGNIWQMTQLDVRELGPPVSIGPFSSFYVEGDRIVLVQPPTATNWSLRFMYARRPSQVVLEEDCTQITEIDGNTITCDDGYPATFTNGTAMSFVHGGSSFLPFSGDFSMPTPVGDDATFSSLPDGLEVGDWLCLYNQSPFPAMPADLQPALVQRLVAVVLRADGDEKNAVEWSAFKEMAQNAKANMAPRVLSSPKGLRGALQRYGRGGGWRGW